MSLTSCAAHFVPIAMLELQAAYEDAFARARYDLRLNYEEAV